MNKFVLIAAALATSTSPVLAEDTPSKNAATDLQSKEMMDHPGTAAGTTADPTAKPASGSLSEKAMEDHPGVTKQ